MHRADLSERPWIMKRFLWQLIVAGLWGRNDGVWSWLVSPGYSLWVLAAEQRSFLQRLTEINSETFRPADKCVFPGAGWWCCSGRGRQRVVLRLARVVAAQSGAGEMAVPGGREVRCRRWVAVSCSSENGERK